MVEPVRDDFEPYYIWGPIVSVFVLNIVLYLVGQLLKDNSIVDITWGFTFLTPLAVVWIMNENFNHRTILTNCLVFVWAVRMAINNQLKHDGEDWRFAEMRENWIKKGKTVYYLAAYFQIYFMQSIFQIIMNASPLFISIWAPGEFYFLDALGAGIWLVGFLIELIADIQLQAFRRHPLNKGKLMTKGLWRYSRHPNYFGESVEWWGIFLIACSVEKGWITFYGPLITTLLLRYVSGVPILEKKYSQREDFKRYMKETNCFVPWFYKPFHGEIETLDQSINSKKDNEKAIALTSGNNKNQGHNYKVVQQISPV
eukprot:403361636